MVYPGGQSNSSGNAYQIWAIARAILALYCRQEGTVRANLPRSADLGSGRLTDRHVVNCPLILTQHVG